MREPTIEITPVERLPARGSLARNRLRIGLVLSREERPPSEARGVATLVSSFRKLRDTFTGLLEENRLLREENQHLREVLSECVEACARFVDHPQAEALHEGQEVDHARAWLALDTAKGVLAQPKQLGFVEERNANEPRTK